MGAIEDLEKQLAALRAKRAPAKTDEQLEAEARETQLREDIRIELCALRQEENERIIKQYAPTARRRFFDFDPNMEQPDAIEYKGERCALYTRFVVCAANADMIEKNGDAIEVRGIVNGKPDIAINTAKSAEVIVECAHACVVYPTPESAGVTKEQHEKNVRASLWFLGAARATLGQAAIELGGVAAAEHKAKS